MKTKKIIALIAVLSLLLCSCQRNFNIKKNSDTQENNIVVSDKEEIKAVWISYNELSMKSQGGGSEADFRLKAEEMINNCKNFGFNRVIVQVRPFSDAFYKSSLFPSTEYLSGVQGVDVEYDALKIMSETAHSQGIKIDAWINPYRVSYKTDLALLADTNPAKMWLASDETTRNVIVLPNGIYYNPASSEVKKLITDGVRELMMNYNIDGIHLDDYFYPVTDESFDIEDYNEYLASGGVLSHDDWRRENISSLMSNIHTVIKSVNNDALLTVSPMGDIQKNYSQYYADVYLWCSQSGYIDVIMPQLYYGFNNSAKPFSQTADEWQKAVKTDDVRLCFGIAVYKCGKQDTYAGDGLDEWIENTNIIKRQLEKIKTLASYSGYSFYSYSYVFSQDLTENAKTELQNIRSMIE